MKLALNALAFAVGCTIPWLLPWLLPWWILPPLVVISVIAGRGIGRGAIILFLVGFGYGLFVANQTNLHQLPDFPHGLDAVVRGRIVDLPDYQQQRARFLFVVDEFKAQGNEQIVYAPRRLRLTWYYPEAISAGDSYQFEVRLRRPRGLTNPLQFDYRQWLLAEGIDATGYVRQFIGHETTGSSSGLRAWREAVRHRLQNSGFRRADLMAALAIGDRSQINADQWQLFATTGIIHLMVISGLHLGFASVLGYWCGSWCLRPLVLLNPRWKAQNFGWLCALIVAFLYAYCAGFSTPTLRALIMIFTLAITQLLGVRISIWSVLSLAFALVLFLQPLSVLSAGLWMSFGAVAVLVAGFQGRPRENKLLGLVRAQVLLFVGFSTIPLAFGNFVPLVAPLVNLVAVPLVGMVVVPLVLLGLAVGLFSSALQSTSWQIADSCLETLVNALRWFQAMDFPQIYPPQLSLWMLALLVAIAFALVALPLRARLWPLLLLGLLPLYIPKQEGSFLTLHIFDVGQGTSVLVQQRGYMLLYDTGPAFSQNFNAGRDIVLPRVTRDRESVHDLMVSHGDADHAGGAEALVASGWVNGRILVGESLGLDSSETACHQPMQWQVGDVSYRIIHPPEDFTAGNNNDLSCVLLVSFADQQILLPGDISRSVEQDLLKQISSPVDVVLVPHHGSATSSSANFVRQLEPDVALVSSGYGNAFGHPVDAVIDRYQAVGARVINTATAGAINIRWQSPTAEAEISLARDAYTLWWQE